MTSSFTRMKSLEEEVLFLRRRLAQTQSICESQQMEINYLRSTVRQLNQLTTQHNVCLFCLVLVFFSMLFYYEFSFALLYKFIILGNGVRKPTTTTLYASSHRKSTKKKKKIGRNGRRYEHYYSSKCM